MAVIGFLNQSRFGRALPPDIIVGAKLLHGEENPMGWGQGKYRSFVNLLHTFSSVPESAEIHQIASRFSAQNFLLEERVPAPREESYPPCQMAELGVASLPGEAQLFQTWSEHHRNYLKKDIGYDKYEKDTDFQYAKAEEIPLFPETFRFSDMRCPESDDDLVRVVNARWVAHEALDTRLDLIKVAKSWAKSSPWATQSRATPPASLVAGLERWVEKMDLRPVFATYWSDVKHLFGATVDQDTPGWGDALRDKLGLAHFNPVLRLASRARSTSNPTLPIFVFRYPPDVVPKESGSASRLISSPTVLDGDLSAAFVPTPRHNDRMPLAFGFAVDLSGPGKQHVRAREVVHPKVLFRAEHLYRVGECHGFDEAKIVNARQVHLSHLRQRFERPDFGGSLPGTEVRSGT